MKAICIERYGGPEVLVYREVPVPQVPSGHVLIRVATTNVNYADVHTRSGVYRRGETFPFIPGLEAAGTVVEVGKDVQGLEIGQRIVAFSAQGSYSEFMLARASLTYVLPDTLSFEAAAGLTAAVTAENILQHIGLLTREDTILIHAAAGGVGSLCVQLSKLYGAKQIIATAGSDEKIAFAKRLGAHHVINYRHKDFAEQVYELTAARGADLILDSVGGEVSAKSVRCLSDFGRLVVFGQASGVPGHVETDQLYKQNKRVLGYSSGHFRKTRPEVLRPAAEAILEHLRAGTLEIVVGATLPLRDAAEAHRLVESRQIIGKVILVPKQSPSANEAV